MKQRSVCAVCGGEGGKALKIVCTGGVAVVAVKCEVCQAVRGGVEQRCESVVVDRAR